jgi:alpha-galactosidase/6-phospho-beta-glucosidase family protein
MRYLICMVTLLFVSPAYADRVCLDKSTGKLIEYQSGDAPLGTLTQNAVNSGYKKKDIEEKYITREEWLEIRKEQIEKPEREKEEQKKQERGAKENSIKQKLGLSDNDFQDLKEALKD